ncbi:hypothetical protein M5689_000899 [Euphorbia peplus]|nr:hypothetical protein M5689_000899 [Euphorbia peplus]
MWPNMMNGASLVSSYAVTLGHVVYHQPSLLSICFIFAWQLYAETVGADLMSLLSINDAESRDVVNVSFKELFAKWTCNLICG